MASPTPTPTPATNEPRSPPQVARGQTATRLGGYNCEFVEKPPEAVQSDCPICLSILCDPHQVTCCGYSFCQKCIDRVRVESKPCPTCNEEGFMTFADKRLQRSLNPFKVHCPHKDDGCEWTGELGELDKHLNENPTNTSNRLRGCQYVEVDCLYCTVPFQRRVTEHHVKEECPLTVVECGFLYAGCGVKLPRKDMTGHLAESLVTHMSLLAVHGKKTAADAQKALEERDKQIFQLREANHQKDCEIAKLQEEMKELKDKLHSHLHTPPVTFTITDFEQHKRNEDTWYSPPFYTHPHGYKMCVKVVFIDDSCFFSANLMHGKFDNYLQWPFQKVVIFRIPNLLSDDNHITIACDFPYDSAGDNVGLRVTVGERQLEGLGDCIAYATLNCHGDSAKNCQYLRDDCIQLQVTRVMDSEGLQREIAATIDHKSIRTPPCQFIMRDFEQHKKDGDRWYSPSFYTHPQGYRMSLSVYANGHSSGRGTHVTVYTSLMCGEFDSDLKWPFRSDITIQLLNQLEDKEHHTMTIPYTDRTPNKYASRVTIGEKACEWGFYQFIPHSKLGLNRSSNCQFLKDDQLTFKITKIDLKNK